MLKSIQYFGRMVHTSLISKHILSTNLNLHDKPMNHNKSEASLNKSKRTQYLMAMAD